MPTHEDKPHPETMVALKRFYERGNQAQEGADRILGHLTGQNNERPEMRTGQPAKKPVVKTEEFDLDFRIGRAGGKVFIDFKRRLSDIYLTGNQAIEFGNALLKHGRKLNKGK